MPVILDNGSEDLRTWLDPKRSTWTGELQSLLRPWHGELDIYAVSKDVGKVGNNSATFIVPVASAENKNNIANFFGNAKKPKIEKIEGEKRATVDHSGTEDNAPLPAPESKVGGVKRDHAQLEDIPDAGSPPVKSQKTVEKPMASQESPSKSQAKRATRSATSNGTAQKAKGSPAKGETGNQRITAFFGK